MTRDVEGTAGLTDIYVTRSAEAGSALFDRTTMYASMSACFDLRRVEWRETRWSADTGKCICRFRAPDAESVRIALRRAGIPFNSVTTQAPSCSWTGEL